VRSSKTPPKLTAPAVVLMNGDTASAAELFCAALRDYNEKGIISAQLVGERTYGKGTMQGIFKLSDGSAISISEALYSPPYGDNYEGVGVSPDHVVILTEDLLAKKYGGGLADNEDTQLQKALEVIGGM